MRSSIIKNRVYLFLLIVVLLAGILRFYKINDYPVSLYWDEVSSTYNAYSISNTGKDEFGYPHPLLFRAFEDYKTPANIYLTSFAVKLFGLNEFSARFSSAFLGTLTVLVTFLLVKEILGKKYLGIASELIALLTSFFLAISPWHIQFSRTGFEANVGLFFVVLGALFLFRFIRSEKPVNLYLSSAIFAVSIYFYRSIWVFVPLLIVSFLFIYREYFFSKKTIKQLLLAGVIFLIIVAPFAPVMVSKQGLVRAQQVNVIDNSQEKIVKFISNQQNTGGIIGKTVFNRRVVYVQEFTKGYLSHFSPNFLFLQGDGNGRHGVKGVGVLYVWGAIFLIPGIIGLFKLDKRTRAIVILWVLIAPIPAAFSVPAPHALRSLNAIPIPQLLCALGFIFIFISLKKKYLKILFCLGTFFVILFFSARYLYAYYGPSANLTSSQWGDGYKQLTEYVFANEEKYDKIIVSGHYWQPYIYFLFYKKYDPKLFQKRGNKAGFDKYIFGGTSWDMNGKELGDRELRKLSGPGNVLVALSPVEYSFQKENIGVSREIKNHNNELVFIVGKLR